MSANHRVSKAHSRLLWIDSTCHRPKMIPILSSTMPVPVVVDGYDFPDDSGESCQLLQTPVSQSNFVDFDENQ